MNPKPAGKSKSLSLAGTRVLVGRARHQAGALSSALAGAGAEVTEIPFIEIRLPRSYRALDEALRNLGGYDWLIFTSVNGVEGAWARMEVLHLGWERFPDLKIAAIGPATKKAVERRGKRVNVTPGEYVAEAVVKSLRDRVRGKRVLLARAKVARDVIPRELRQVGAAVNVVEAYQTAIPASSRRKLRVLLSDSKRRPHVIAFTSSSTVRNFASLVGIRAARSLMATGVRFASIGPITSGTLRSLGLAPQIEAEAYDMPGLVRAIAESASDGYT